MPFCAGGPRTQATAQKTATWLPGNADGHRIAQADAAAGLRRDVDVIAARPPHMNVVLTGRDAPAELIDLADTVTEMVKVKHPYDRGIKARRGLDF